MLLECSCVWLLLSITEIFLSQMRFLLDLEFVSLVFQLPSRQQRLSCFGGRKELGRYNISFSAKISVTLGIL